MVKVGISADKSKSTDFFKKLSPKIKEMLLDALKKTAEQTEKQAIRNAPVEDGGLKKSIMAEQTGEFHYAVKAKAPHAHLVEFGTAPRKHEKTGKRTGKMPAQPFLLPAARLENKRLQGRISRGVRKIKKEENL